MSTYPNPPKPSNDSKDNRVYRTKEQWLQSNPFITEETAQKLVDNPPLKQPPEDRDILIP